MQTVDEMVEIVDENTSINLFIDTVVYRRAFYGVGI